MLYEISLFALGFLIGATIILFIGWRGAEREKKQRRGMLFLTIEGIVIDTEEPTKLKGVDEVSKTGLGKDDLEKKR